MTKFADSKRNGYEAITGELYRWAKLVREEVAQSAALQEGTR
jgi:hypothetical protein